MLVRLVSIWQLGYTHLPIGSMTVTNSSSQMKDGSLTMSFKLIASSLLYSMVKIVLVHSMALIIGYHLPRQR